MFDHDIYIRIAEERMTFVFTIRRAGELIQTGTVDADEYVAPGYYGGSEVMD